MTMGKFLYTVQHLDGSPEFQARKAAEAAAATAATS